MTKLGCIRDKFDERDYLMRAYLPLVKLPGKVNYTAKLSPVRDQGNEGTCVGFATAVGMKEYQEKLDYEKLVTLSPRFVYNECKKIDDMPDMEGTTIRTAMKVLADRGVCQEKFWPYSPHQENKPRKGAVTNARRFRVKSYARILDLDELRLSLFTKGPCVIGVRVFSGFSTPREGIVPMPTKAERSRGGHAICPVGYDDREELIKFKNSWSESWGNEGYGFLHYRYVTRYLIDAWSSVDIEDPNPLTFASVLNAESKIRNRPA